MKKIKYNEVVKINSIKEMLKLAVKEAGEKIAFKYKGKKDEVIEVTYKEFEDDTNQLGTALASINMQDKHIAMIGENSYKWITGYLTVLKSKGVFLPVDKELTVKEIINVLKHGDAEVLFYAGRYEKWIEEIKVGAPNIKYFIGLDREEDADNVLSYDKFKAKGKDLLEQGNTKYTELQDDEYNLKLLVYTSGTTGEPKGVMLSEHNLISVVNYGLQVADIKTTCLSVLPYHHTYEAVAGLLVALHKRACICINDSLKNVLKNLQLFKPDYIYVVPAFTEIFYKNIWNNAQKTGKDKVLKIMIPVSNALRKIGIDLRGVFFKSIHQAFGGNLREIVCGGAPIRPEVGKFFNDIGMMLLNGYGITECSPLVSVNRLQLNDSSTVGVILPCCEVKFENVTPEGDGEIHVKGDIVMMGYYKEKEKTDRVLKDGWFNTEDYGRINKKGQLIINGRKKNLIVLDNGKNVYPEEIENYILGVPYVQEVVVRGKKNDIGQEVGLIAEVFLNKEKVEELKVENIKETLKNDISKATKDLPVYKRISDIEIRETEFNKTTTNKIKR
ncbi:MAG: AMP-dependent synthetase [Clostridiales bacterium]|nr:AMP-dependent synthetase [Clostridiales bacterium]